MPKITLSDREVEEDNLPPVCMISGEEAGALYRKTFAWTPSWVIFTICAGLLVYVILAVILTKRMTVHAPVAARHRGYWWKRTIAWALPLVGSLALGVVAIVVGSGPQPVNADAGVVLGVAAGVGFFASIVLGAFLQSTGVRAIGISDRDITFGGVHENFIAAVEELREERRAKRRERRLAEDAGDEDDDRPRRRRRSAENDDRD